MGKIGLMKKMLAFSLSIVTAVTVMTGGKQIAWKENSAIAATEAEKNAAAIKKAKDDISDLESQQKELDKKIKDAQKDIKTEQDAQESINEQISVVEKTIEKYEETIKKYDEDIDSLTEEIAKSEENIKKKQEEIEQGVEDFKKRIRLMYINGTDSYTDILAGAKDFYDMLMKLELVKRVANHDNNMINDLLELKRQYEQEKQTLEDNKSSLEAKRKEQQEQKEKKQSQLDKLEDLYKQSKENEEQLKKDEASFKKNKDELTAEKEAFEADLQELYKKEEARKKKEAEEAEKKRQAELARQKAIQQQQQQSNASNSGGSTSSNNTSQSSTNNSDYGYSSKSQFTWPVPGFYHISYGVGWRWGAYHQGIDIYSSNIRGAKICAAANGTVIRVVNGCTHDYGKSGSCGCGGGYGNYCIIDHGNGYWTLYGHSEGIIVSVGQQVSQGQVIGTVGSTGYSTGPHLHFEVRLNGVAQNPSNYV